MIHAIHASTLCCRPKATNNNVRFGFFLPNPFNDPFKGFKPASSKHERVADPKGPGIQIERTIYDNDSRVTKFLKRLANSDVSPLNHLANKILLRDYRRHYQKQIASKHTLIA